MKPSPPARPVVHFGDLEEFLNAYGRFRDGGSALYCQAVIATTYASDEVPISGKSAGVQLTAIVPGQNLSAFFPTGSYQEMYNRPFGARDENAKDEAVKHAEELRDVLVEYLALKKAIRCYLGIVDMGDVKPKPATIGDEILNWEPKVPPRPEPNVS